MLLFETVSLDTKKNILKEIGAPDDNSWRCGNTL
jgi:hypothetical protein